VDWTRSGGTGGGLHKDSTRIPGGVINTLFLHSQIAGWGPDHPKMAHKRFRNIFVITAFNA